MTMMPLMEVHAIADEKKQTGKWQHADVVYFYSADNIFRISPIFLLPPFASLSNTAQVRMESL